MLAVGIRRTTLTDIARRAGVSRMTVYRKVDDVDTLLLAVVTREFSALVLAAEAAARELPTARERLVATAARVIARLPAEPLFRRVVDVDPELFLPYVTERFGSTQRIAQGHVRRLLHEGLVDGSVAGCDPESRAWTVVVALTAFALSRPLLERAMGEAVVEEEVRQMLDRWLSPATPERRPRR